MTITHKQQFFFACFFLVIMYLVISHTPYVEVSVESQQHKKNCMTIRHKQRFFVVACFFLCHHVYCHFTHSQNQEIFENSDLECGFAFCLWISNMKSKSQTEPEQSIIDQILESVVGGKAFRSNRLTISKLCVCV